MPEKRDFDRHEGVSAPTLLLPFQNGEAGGRPTMKIVRRGDCWTRLMHFSHLDQ
jgi:hypothetical protein